MTKINWSSLLGLFRALVTPAILLTGVATSCGGSSNANGHGGETHWLLRCSSEQECEGDFDCRCGVCTMTCSEQSDCNKFSEAICSDSSSTAFSDECAADNEQICVTTSDLVDSSSNGGAGGVGDSDGVSGGGSSGAGGDEVNDIAFLDCPSSPCDLALNSAECDAVDDARCTWMEFMVVSNDDSICSDGSIAERCMQLPPGGPGGCEGVRLPCDGTGIYAQTTEGVAVARGNFCGVVPDCFQACGWGDSNQTSREPAACDCACDVAQSN